MNRKLPLGLRFLRGLGAFLLCLVIFVSAIATMLITTVRIATSERNLTKIITRSLFTVSAVRHNSASLSGTGTLRAPVISPVRLNPHKLAEESEDPMSSSFMVEFLYDAMKDQFGEDVPISLDTVQDFVEQSTVKDFLAEKSASLINDFVNGKNTTTITAEEIQTQLQENAPLIEDCFGIELDEEIITTITESVTKTEVFTQIQEEGLQGVLMSGISGGSSGNAGNAGNSGNESSGDKGNSDNQGNSGNQGSSENQGGNDLPSSSPLAIATKLLNDARAVTSAAALLICLGVTVVAMGLLCLMYLKQIYTPIRKIGFTVLAACIPFLFLTGIPLFAKDFLANLFADNPLVGNICREVLLLTAPLSISVAAVSLVLIIGGIVLYFIMNRKPAPAVSEEAAVSESSEIPAETSAEN